jgi:hypothetical protein
MANYQPPTEDVPIFNGKYFTAENITTANGDGRYLKLIAQGDEDMNDFDLLNVNQVDTQSVKFGDGTIQTTANPGGGGVQNPMTTNLDANNFNIINAGLMDTFYLQNQRVNNADAIRYINLGAITAGDKYLIGRSTNRTAMEGNIMFVLRTLDGGFKQEILAEVIAFPDKSVIRIINNVVESDNIPIPEILYEDDPNDPFQSVLCFKCGISATRCDLLIYQNGNDNNTLGSQFILPTTLTTIPASTNVYTNILLELQTAGTSGNWRVKDTIKAQDTQTSTLGTNAIRELTATADIQILNNINLNGTNIKNVNTISTDNIGVNTASEISSTASINMGGNDLQNTNNIYTDNIFENTPANDVVVHNTLNMNNNHIHNLLDPTQNKDGANKQYVDNAVSGFLTNPLSSNLDGGTFKGVNFSDPTLAQDLATKSYVDTTSGSGVQNPMTSNLDGGTFQITNVSQFSNVPTTGLISSNGTFQHIASAGSFQVGGTDATFDTDVNIRNGATNIMNITKNTQKIDIRAGTTLEYDPNSIQTFQAGGHNIQYQSNTARTTYNGEISTTFQPAVRRNDFLTLTGNAYGNSVIPMCISPLTTQQLYTNDVAVYVPFNPPILGWDATNNGAVIPIINTNSLSFIEGLPPGVNNNDIVNTPFDGHFIGIGLNNASSNGGWTCGGLAYIELVYKISGATYLPFNPPVIIAGAGAPNASFNQKNVSLPYNSWVEATSSDFGFIQLGLRLMISGADVIDTQDPVNNSINACAYILTHIPLF